ncbi:hypothetical protein [Ferruginibacter albus]|uniref:hypothetical protein n=1 Tax=Ferruginibacter albus TaxID=2875540 RepID=UPI001CC40C99|nr:hypothetical protein [Ferruginibacter albus]UAY51290.1 hypothetical protein K9M53_11895 [Ferruginibacter albus]
MSLLSTEWLVKCAGLINDDFLSYDSGENNDVVTELLDNFPFLPKKFVEPFSEELNMNLLCIESPQGKRNVLIHYIKKFAVSENFFDHNRKYIHDNLKTKDKKPVRSLWQIENKYARYIKAAHIFFDLLFAEIQMCCVKYKIDFFKICNEISFPLDLVSVDTASQFFLDNEITPKVTNPAIGLFCWYVSQSGVIVRGEESIEVYCKKVCAQYKLAYKERVRTHFSCNNNKKNLDIIIQNILPSIDSKSRKKIEDYLASSKKSV